MENIELIILNHPDPEQLADISRLFVQAEFAEAAEDVSWLAGAIDGSVAAVAARDRSSGRIVGFARALGDRVSDCYIQDVVVDEQYRRRGIGRELIAFLICEIKKLNIDWIGLVSAPGKEEFYRQLGFETLEKHVPMIFKALE